MFKWLRQEVKNEEVEQFGRGTLSVQICSDQYTQAVAKVKSGEIFCLCGDLSSSLCDRFLS